MLTKSHTSLGGKEWESVFKHFVLNSVRCPDLHIKLMFDNLPMEKGWGQLTNIFVLDITLFCSLDHNPQPFVVIWGIRKYEFHAVPYISCNFHQKLFLVRWPNALLFGSEIANIKLVRCSGYFMQFPAMF